MDFQDLFADLSETLVVVSPEFKVLAATNAYLKVTMRTRPEILGKIFIKEVYEDPSITFEENPVIQSISRAIANKKVDYLEVLRYDLEKPASEGGGYEVRYWEASHTPVLDETGQLKYVIQKTVDVTERELAKKEKEKSEEKFRFIADAVSQLIYKADDKGQINYVNQRWLNYTGLTASELFGSPWPKYYIGMISRYLRLSYSRPLPILPSSKPKSESGTGWANTAGIYLKVCPCWMRPDNR